MPATNDSGAIIMQEGKLLVYPDKVPELTAGGIVTPEIAKEKPTSGAVTAHHPSSLYTCYHRVFYPHWAGIEVKINGETYHIVLEKEVWYGMAAFEASDDLSKEINNNSCKEIKNNTSERA